MLELRRFPVVVTRGMAVVGGIAAVIAAALHIATFGPGSWEPTITAVWPVLFFAIFPIAGSAIALMSFADIPIELVPAGLPLAIKIGLVGLTVYVAVNFALFFRATAGSSAPAPMLVARGFTGHAIYFFTAAVVLWYQLDRIRAGKLDAKRGARDDAMEQNPLPAPLSRSVVLQTQLSPAECAIRLTQAPPPRFFTLSRNSGLRGEANPEMFRLQMGRSQSSLVYALGRFEATTPTFIRVLLTFKRWYLISFAASALFLGILLVLSPFVWPGILFVLLFGVGGNLVYGRAQMRTLLRRIQQLTEAQEVSIG